VGCGQSTTPPRCNGTVSLNKQLGLNKTLNPGILTKQEAGILSPAFLLVHREAVKAKY
jgi:hypothetical protein